MSKLEAVIQHTKSYAFSREHMVTATVGYFMGTSAAYFGGLIGAPLHIKLLTNLIALF